MGPLLVPGNAHFLSILIKYLSPGVQTKSLQKPLLGAFRREEVHVRYLRRMFFAQSQHGNSRQIQAYGETVQLRYLRENDCHQRRTRSPREKSPPVDPDENVLRLQVRRPAGQGKIS